MFTFVPQQSALDFSVPGRILNAQVWKLFGEWCFFVDRNALERKNEAISNWKLFIVFVFVLFVVVYFIWKINQKKKKSTPSI